MSADPDLVEREVFQLLPLIDDVKFLLEVCNGFKLVIDADKQGNKHFLLKRVLKYLNSDEIGTLEDQGTSLFLKLNDDLKCYLKVDTDPADGIKKEVPIETSVQNAGSNVHIHKFREFKIHGTVGEPEQKDKLSYMSLSYQIQNGKKEGRSGAEICAAVIKSITPGSSLRNYLESRVQTDEKSLIRVLRSHFNEKDSSTVFNDMSNCVQGASESELDFCLRAMSLRQKVVMLASEEGCPYDSQLIQKRFFHAIFTGLKHNNIRHELQHVLKEGKISDEDLLREISLTVANELEHSMKTKVKSPNTGFVNNIDSNLPEKTVVKKKENPLLTEINKLSTQVNELSNMKKEIADLRHEIRSYDNIKPSFPNNLSAEQFSPRQNSYSKQNMSPAGLYSRQNRNRDFRCGNCKQSKNNYCNHCFQCGEAGHRRNQCKEKN